jgi:hypothetical protein
MIKSILINHAMKQILLLLLLTGFYLTACHKTDSGTKNKGSLLTKYVKILNQDSVVYEFNYDNNNRVTLMKFTGTGFGPSLNIQTTQIIRNNSGIVLQLVNSYPSPNPQLNPNDTTNITYDNSTGRYMLLLTYHRIDASGQPVDRRDSTLLTYDGNGKIAQKKSYSFDIATGTSYALYSSHSYSYDQQENLVTDSVVSYMPISSVAIPQWVIKYTYDNNSSPLRLGNEALFILDRDWIGLPRISGWVSKNNVVTGYYTQIQSTISNFSIQRNFSYNATGLPTGSTDQWWTPTVGTSPGSTRYYYQ